MWRPAQWLAMAGGVALVLGFVWRPAVSVGLWWNLLVPLVIASLLAGPHLWRNLCPVATISLWPNGWMARRIPGAGTTRIAASAGILLLVVVVSLRHGLLNHDGAALAAAVGLGTAAAFLLGSWFEAKSGFCNTLCPMLPVERLLGQAPLLAVENARCDGCQLCSARGCLDLSPTLAVPHTLGATRHSHRWLFTPFGAFAAAYPGLVGGYFQAAGRVGTDDGTAVPIMLVWMGLSYAVVALGVGLAKIPADRMMPSLAAVAAATYFWHVLPATLQLFGADGAAPVVRLAAVTAVGAWWWRAIYSRSRVHDEKQ